MRKANNEKEEIRCRIIKEHTEADDHIHVTSLHMAIYWGYKEITLNYRLYRRDCHDNCIRILDELQHSLKHMCTNSSVRPINRKHESESTDTLELPIRLDRS